MNGSRPRKGPLVVSGIEEGVSTSSYLAGDPYDHGREPKAPSPAVVAILEHNRDLIHQIARVSALQGIAISCARNESGDVGVHIRKIEACIERLVADAVDNKIGQTNERLELYEVRVLISIREGGSHRSRDLHVLEVDISIPLESCLLHAPSPAYGALRKAGDAWFPEE